MRSDLVFTSNFKPATICGMLSIFSLIKNTCYSIDIDLCRWLTLIILVFQVSSCYTMCYVDLSVVGQEIIQKSLTERPILTLKLTFNVELEKMGNTQYVVLIKKVYFFLSVCYG